MEYRSGSPAPTLADFASVTDKLRRPDQVVTVLIGCGDDVKALELSPAHPLAVAHASLPAPVWGIPIMQVSRDLFDGVKCHLREGLGLPPVPTLDTP